jgi:tetratricopeptide (TPR) repeat protein
VLFLLVLGTRYYLAQQDERAKDALSQALRTYHAQVGTQATPVSGSDPIFASAAEKFQKALTEFQKVSSSYPSRPAGKIAQYYTGLCLWEMKRPKEAIAALEPLAKDETDYGVLAQRVLAAVHEGSGELAKAAEIYQKIVQSDSAVVPKTEGLMHLAQLYEQQNKPAEATKIYQQVVKDFPGTAYVTEAEQKLKQLSR